MSRHPLSRHVVATTALCASLAVVGVSAQAAPGDETLPPVSATAELVDPATPVSLTITKYAGDPVTPPTTGAPADTTGLTPLEGVTFTVQRLEGIDLTTQEGWAALSGVTAEDVAAGAVPGVTLSDTATLVTGPDGVAAVSTGTNAAFTTGAYLVTETQFGNYTVAPPFLVTLPYSSPETGTWVYDRAVYPKNQDVTPDKQVDDNAATIGTNLRYTINAPVPAGELTTFTITDPLSADLALQSDPAAVVTVSDADGSNPIALDAADYTVTYDANTLVVTFTDAGRAKLQTARADRPALEAHVEFQAQVVGISDPSGVITNTATVAIPGGTVTTDSEVGPTSTTFAPLTITKTAPDAAAGELDGAVFEVYHCEQIDGEWQLRGDALDLATTPTGTPTTTLTTSGGGSTSAANAFGVPATSYSGGDTGPEVNTYCALETTAPAGFLRNPEPQPITYNAGAPGSFTVSVVNQRDTLLGQLPATGAWGVGLLLLLGGALVARGVMAGRREERVA